MKYKVGDVVRVRRSVFIVKCKIVSINDNYIHPYLVEGSFTTGRTSDDYILGYWEAN